MAAALLGAALLGLGPAGGTAQAEPARPGLTELTAELAAVTAHAQSLSLQLDSASARNGGFRVALERAQTDHDDAQQRLNSRARSLYMAQQVDPLGGWQLDLAQPDLRALARRGQAASLQVDRALVDAVSGQQSRLRRLQGQAEALRARLLGQAAAVLADQDRARALLAQASALAQRAAAAERVVVERELVSQTAALDAVSQTVTLALTPAQTTRTRAAASSQAAVVALLESTGSGIPTGYARSGQTQSGTASWYGPGFVGRPTASGAPYDPERLTCANKQVPLGTVLHVSANGLSVNCLVNDRGPYVGDRVLDMSRAGSRALGYDGLAQVTIEVLVPV